MTEFNDLEKQKLYEDMAQEIQLWFYRELEDIFIQRVREIGQLQISKMAKLQKLYEDIRDGKVNK